MKQLYTIILKGGFIMPTEKITITTSGKTVNEAERLKLLCEAIYSLLNQITE